MTDRRHVGVVGALVVSLRGRRAVTDLWAIAGFSPDGDVDDAGGTEPWGEDSLVPAPEQDVPSGGLKGAESGLSEVVAGNIRLEAARVGVTQAELARFLGMSRSAVSLRFTGRVDWRVGEVGQVAWYLNLPATDLFVRPRGAHRDFSW